MKILYILALSLFSINADAQDVFNDSVWVPLDYKPKSRESCHEITEKFMGTPVGAAQPKWYAISKNDVLVMSAQFLAGYATGWREEIVYHAPALFKRFPNLNRRFWDSRLYHRWNANHWLKTAATSFHAIGIVIKLGDKKKNWKYYAADGIKFYGAYKVGFWAAYNVTHKNKLTL